MGDEAETHEAIRLMKHLKTAKKTATELGTPPGFRHNNASGFKCFSWPCFHNLSSCQKGSRLVSYGLPSPPSPGDLLSFSPLSFTQHCALCLFTASIQGPLTADVAGGESLSKTPQRPLIVCVTLISKNSRLKSEPKRFSTSLANDPNFSVYILCKRTASTHWLLWNQR